MELRMQIWKAKLYYSIVDLYLQLQIIVQFYINRYKYKGGFWGQFYNFFP